MNTTAHHGNIITFSASLANGANHQRWRNDFVYDVHDGQNLTISKDVMHKNAVAHVGVLFGDGRDIIDLSQGQSQGRMAYA